VKYSDHARFIASRTSQCEYVLITDIESQRVEVPLHVCDNDKNHSNGKIRRPSSYKFGSCIQQLQLA